MENLRMLRKQHNRTQQQMATFLGLSQQAYATYENDRAQPPIDILQKLADFFSVSVDHLLGRDDNPQNIKLPNNAYSTDIVLFEEIGTVCAGYDGIAVEEPTGRSIPIPAEMLKGRSPDEFFVLRIKGDSMYPRLLENDSILCLRCTSVESGDYAVVLYDSDEATVKQVRYVKGEDWLELIPTNPEYKTKRIEGADLEQCRILGKVVKLIRDF